MKKAWNYITHLGIETHTTPLDRRSIKLNNQLNLIVLLFSGALLILLVTINIKDKTPMGIGTLRTFFLSLVVTVNLVLSRFRLHNLSKLSLIFLAPFIFIIFPTIIGFVEEESYVYYPYVLAGFSILPQLLILPNKNRRLLALSVFYYFLLVFFIDRLLLLFTPEEFPIISRIETFYLFYKLAPVCVFIFINISVYYLRKLNIQFEKEVRSANENLDKQNEELIEAIDKLKTTQLQLIQSEKWAALGTLIAGVAHEINNPLNYLYGGLTLLDEFKDVKELKASKEDYINQLETATRMLDSGVERISHIMKSLMTFTNRAQPVLVMSDINQIIDNTLLFLNFKIPDHLIIKKEYSLNTEIPIYQDMLHQVFLNIFNNAIFAIEQREREKKEKLYIRTRLEAQNEDRTVIIEIENTGPPIPEDQLSKVFDPFMTTKDPDKGIGLGLSISYNFIREHNGTITVINTSRGVNFIITLPVIE